MFELIRRLALPIAGVAALALSGCSSRPAESEAANTTAAATSGADTTSPCNLPGAWSFHGSCTVESITAAGGVFALPSYRGLALTLTFGKNDVSRSAPFVVGDATGNGDVGGKLMDRLDFGGYGSGNCLTQERVPTACPGKALLYYIVVNVGETPVTFETSPAIVVESTRPFTGIRRCTLATMVWADDARTSMAWLVRPVIAIPHGIRLAFAPVRIPQLYASGGAFTIFSIACF